MGRLRIAVVTPELPNREYPHRGRSVYQTLRHLSEYADVQALCPLPRYPAYLHPRRFDYRESDLSYALPDVRADYFEYPALPIVSRPINGFTSAHYLEPRLRAFRADVILNFLLYPAGFAALTVGRKLNLPVVVGSIGSDVNAIPDPITRWLTQRTLNGASRVIAKSEQLRVRIVDMGVDPEKLHVVPNGCDGNVFFIRDRERARRELRIPAEAEVIAFVGRLHRSKGVFELLEAVAALSHRRPNVRLVYVGDGPELRALRQRACTNNIPDVVDFPGACAPTQVAQWLAASNLLALPSYAEGSPNAVIEALSCGRPVVATPVGAVPELVDPSCGMLVPATKANVLTDALESVLSSSWDEHFIAKRFRRTWQQVAQEVLAICEQSRSTVQVKSKHN